MYWSSSFKQHQTSGRVTEFLLFRVSRDVAADNDPPASPQSSSHEDIQLYGEPEEGASELEAPEHQRPLGADGTVGEGARPQPEEVQHPPAHWSHRLPRQCHHPVQLPVLELHTNLPQGHRNCDQIWSS